MTIIVVFCFPIAPQYFDAAANFIASYNLHPAGIDHRLVVVSNGGPPTPDMRCLMDQINHPVEVFQHDNSGYDIGAYQAAAHALPCDMMVFFGSTAYLRGPNWLKRMAEAFEKHGSSALYGTMGNLGCGNIFPHIRTTSFWMAPMMLNMYPLRVTDPAHRYPAEHGPNCITQWFRNQGQKAIVVTWDQEYDWPSWDNNRNGFHQGDQSALIAGDKISAPPFHSVP